MQRARLAGIERSDRCAAAQRFKIGRPGPFGTEVIAERNARGHGKAARRRGVRPGDLVLPWSAFAAHGPPPHIVPCQAAGRGFNGGF